MDKIITKFGIGLALMIALSAHAQWGSSPGMMPWGGQSFMQPQAQQPFSGGMPWGSGEQRYNQPRYTQGSIMPWGQSRTPAYQAPQAQSFGGMMPFGNMAQPQSRYRQPQSTFMMPGMDQGIRTMMEPGKIMAEEATPGVYMKPTWR
ncbi:MAG TPA: hypothetical protein EYO74_01690 [Piscirickettsiaceae bacterium]|jgi:hypothetical protein|nr:hypothetical protein [Piscirickettsiaceae bacterium]